MNIFSSFSSLIYTMMVSSQCKISNTKPPCTSWIVFLFLVLVDGDDFDDKAGENIIGIMDMWVPLHDKRVIALVTDCVQGLPFSHNVYFITRSLKEVVPFYRLTFFCYGAFPYWPQQYRGQQHHGTVPRRWICSRGTHVQVNYVLSQMELNMGLNNKYKSRLYIGIL